MEFVGRIRLNIKKIDIDFLVAMKLSRVLISGLLYTRLDHFCLLLHGLEQSNYTADKNALLYKYLSIISELFCTGLLISLELY